MGALLLRCVGAEARPSRDFVPAADLLSCVDKKVGKEGAPVPSPLRCAKGSPACLAACRRQGLRQASHSTKVLCSVQPQCIGTQGRAELTSLRSVQTGGAKSVLEARCARALGSCASRLLQRGTPEQPTAKPQNRPLRGIRLAPLSTAEQRKALRACAQRTSRTDSAQLSDRSVAEGVLRGPSRPEQRRAPAASLRAVRSGVASLPTFLSTQESRPPARANSGHGPRQ